MEGAQAIALRGAVEEGKGGGGGWCLRGVDAVHSQIKGLPHVVGIRTLGLAAAVELAPAALPGKRAFDVFMSCFAKGVLVRPAGENLVLCPPYIVEPALIDQMVSVLAQAIREHA